MKPNVQLLITGESLMHGLGILRRWLQRARSIRVLHVKPDVQVLIDAEGMMKVTHMIQMPNLQHDNWGAMPSGNDPSQQVGAVVFSLAPQR